MVLPITGAHLLMTYFALFVAFFFSLFFSLLLVMLNVFTIYAVKEQVSAEARHSHTIISEIIDAYTS